MASRPVTTSTSGHVTFTLHLDHDFNQGRNAAGRHEVLIPAFMEQMIRSGSVVTFGDVPAPDGYIAKGRIVHLIAVIEELPEDDGSTTEQIPDMED